MSGIQAAPIMGPPGFNGYSLNVVETNRQPVQISQIYSGITTYPIAGSTTIIPVSTSSGKAVPFYGSISHGLDQQHSALGPTAGVFGGNGLRRHDRNNAQPRLPGRPWRFQRSGSVIKGDSAVYPTPQGGLNRRSLFYTFNAVAGTVMDTTGKSVTVAGGQYFIDTTDPNNTIYGVVNLPKFTFNGNNYTFNLSTTASDNTTPLYTMIVGGRSYQFSAGNTQVTVDQTIFTFNPASGGTYTVSYANADNPNQSEAPTPIPLTPFTIAIGGTSKTIDVFNKPGDLGDMILGVAGRVYAYNRVAGSVTVTQGATKTTVSLQTGMTFISNSGYGYVVGLNGGYAINGVPMARTRRIRLRHRRPIR